MTKKGKEYSVYLQEEDRQAVQEVMSKFGLPFSAALRFIIREWAKDQAIKDGHRISIRTAQLIDNELYHTHRPHTKIERIKALRNLKDIGLHDAKSIVESLYSSNGEGTPL